MPVWRHVLLNLQLPGVERRLRCSRAVLQCMGGASTVHGHEALHKEGWRAGIGQVVTR